MIGTLFGSIAEISHNQIILDVGGVGYVVNLPNRVIQGYKCDDKIKLYIETYVNRDNVPQLYGLPDPGELDCMRMLVKVSGINYKTALAILDKMSSDQVFSAILNGDKDAFKVGGVGDKLISRIIAELSPQVQKLKFNMLPKKEASDELCEATAALLSLGYEKNKVLSALQKVGDSHPTSETVRLALRELSK